MEGICIVSSCGRPASKCCGSCGLVRYCSVECQKEDWKKIHKKKECVNMKKLASVNLTEEEISDVADRISCICGRHSEIGEAKSSIDIQKECLDFVRDRLARLICDDSRSLTGDGVRLNHLIICRLLVDLGTAYFGINLDMASSSETDSHCISYMSEARELLKQRIDTEIKESEIWELLLICDRSVFYLYIQMGQWEKAKHHCVECVATARQCNVPDQVDYLITALRMLSDCVRRECSFPEALALAEESYILASKHYSPAHKTVLEASSELIECLIATKDYSTADTYCRMNFANIIDPINAGEYEDKDGIDIMNQLVSIWLLKEPDEDEIVEKALADEAVDLSRKVLAYVTNGISMHYRMHSLSRSCRVLLKGNKLTDETEGLLHQLVTKSISENMAGKHIRDSIVQLHTFYLKIYSYLRTGKKTTLVQKNVELCHKKLLELESGTDGSIGYVKGSQKIKPYFKRNAEIYI